MEPIRSLLGALAQPEVQASILAFSSAPSSGIQDGGNTVSGDGLQVRQHTASTGGLQACVTSGLFTQHGTCTGILNEDNFPGDTRRTCTESERAKSQNTELAQNDGADHIRSQK